MSDFSQLALEVCVSQPGRSDGLCRRLRGTWASSERPPEGGTGPLGGPGVVASTPKTPSTYKYLLHNDRSPYPATHGPPSWLMKRRGLP